MLHIICFVCVSVLSKKKRASEKKDVDIVEGEKKKPERNKQHKQTRQSLIRDNFPESLKLQVVHLSFGSDLKAPNTNIFIPFFFFHLSFTFFFSISLAIFFSSFFPSLLHLRILAQYHFFWVFLFLWTHLASSPPLPSTLGRTRSSCQR